jgi:glutaminase
MTKAHQQWADAAVAAARPHVGEGSRPAFLAVSAGSDHHRAAAPVALAYVAVDGHAAGAGPHRLAVSLQSITKLFALAIALAHEGERVWQRVGYMMSDRPYNSLTSFDGGARPPNPFLNAGALVLTDRLHTLTGRAAETVCEFVRDQSGNPQVDIDHNTYAAELEHSLGNTALVYSLASAGLIANPPTVVLEQYVAQCAIAASSLDIARCGLFLADQGRSPSGRVLLSPEQTRQVNGLLTLAGTYGASATTMYRIGWPAKSGVGGAILAVVPGQGAVCASSPRLDEHGNSIAALVALEAFAGRFAESSRPGPA